MRILATQYTLSMKSLDIYTSGCKPPHCDGCHNPDGWDFNNGHVWNDNLKEKISKKIYDFDTLIERLMIFGGEPLDNSIEDVVDFLGFLVLLNKPIWLFTRYNINDVPNEVKLFCSYIKSGKYDKTKKVEDYIQYGITLATSNQKIYKKGLDY